MKLSDYATAGLPVGLTLTLGERNTLVGIVGGVRGIAYLLWRWRREAHSSDK